MPGFTTTCSYCNAIVSLAAPPRPGQRISCARCGEEFIYHGAEPVAETEVPAAPAEPPALPSRRPVSNRAVALAVGGVMTFMALLCLAWALHTVEARREHDRGISKEQEIALPLFLKLIGVVWVTGLVVLLFDTWQRRHAGTEPSARPRWLLGLVAVLATAGLFFVFVSGPLRHRSSHAVVPEDAPVAQPLRPAQMEVLKFVPGDSNIIAGIHVAEALNQPLSRQYLQDFRIGPLELGAERLEQWTGLRLDDMEQLTLALKLEGLLVPRFTLVVRTKLPYQAEAILKKLAAVRIPERVRKDSYRFQLGNSSLKPVLWCPPEGQYLVIALSPGDLDASFDKSTGVENLIQPLRTLLNERMSAPSPVWLAAHSEHWEQTLLAAWLAQVPEQNRSILATMQTLGIWLEFGQDVTLNAAARCATRQAADDLAGLLMRWAKSHLLAARALADGVWVSGQAHTDLASVQRALGAARGVP